MTPSELSELQTEYDIKQDPFYEDFNETVSPEDDDSWKDEADE